MTFDRVLPELLALCATEAAAKDARTLGIVRDVRGRVHLVVEPKPGAPVRLDTLEQQLIARLGGYFVAPVLLTTEGHEQGRLGRQLLELAKRGKSPWPRTWPREYSSALGERIELSELGRRWIGIDRTIGKDAWLDVEAARPWTLAGTNAPPIVTFHSFKGGVGRSTLLGAYALISALAGKRVAVVDLDLEAPGIAALLNTKSARGTLDVLIDEAATGATDLDGVMLPAVLGSPFEDLVHVLGAGPLGATYLGKLARLDYATEAPGDPSPVTKALVGLLKKIRSTGPKSAGGEFDLILIDARAGLHDLSGVALHSLSHVTVLVLRGTDQHLQGLGATLETLGEHFSARPVLVDSLLPARPEEGREWSTRTQEKVYELMCEHIYEPQEPPQLETEGAPHRLVRIRRKDWLDGVDSLAGCLDEIGRDPELRALAHEIDTAIDLQRKEPEDEDVG